MRKKNKSENKAMGALKQYDLNKYGHSKVERQISYVNIPSFSLRVETLLNPSLKNRPIVLASPFIKGARVQECSDEAQREGVKKGMLLSQAELLCSSLEVIQPREEIYSRISSQLEKDIQKMIPLFERENKGKGFIDYTGLEQIYGGVADFHLELKKRINFRYSLSPDFGISCNKLVSKIAAKSLKNSHDDITLIKASEAKSYLAPLPVEFLPIISEISDRQKSGRWDVLDDLNLMFIGDLQRLSVLHLEAAFGKMGRILHDFARGVDFRPVVPIERKSSIVVDFEFKQETNNCRVIFGTIDDLANKAFVQLDEEQRCADSCNILLKYADDSIKEYKIKLKSPLSKISQIKPKLIKTMEKIGERRLALKWIEFELLGVEKAAVQLSIFDTQPQKLHEQITKIQKLFPGKVLSFEQKRNIKKRNA